MSDNKISLFGSTGFIGSHLVKLFPNDFYCEPRENNTPKYNTIIYAIGSNTNYNMFDSLTKDVNDNLVKLNLVLENCKDRDVNFIFLSSWFAYGKTGKVVVNENDQGEVLGYYSICKLAAEQMIKTFCSVYNKKYKILRLANVYGDGDKFSLQKNALQYLINEIKHGRPVYLYHNGDVVRDFLHIEDCCRSIRFLVDNGGDGKYNVSTGRGYDMLSILEFARKRYESQSSFIPCPPTKFHEIVQVKDICLNNEKLRSVYGFDLNFRGVYDYF